MKKYTRLSQDASKDPSAPGVILLLGHGAGFETWEPTIEDLYRMDEERTTGPTIREIWGLDCQNHGEACTEMRSTSRNEGLLTIWDYAEAFATLYKSGLLGTLNPKLHQVVLCGHSAGAVGVVLRSTLSTSYFNPPSRVPFSKIILVDPPIWSKEKDGQDSEMTPVRKDIWKSCEDATKWLKNAYRGAPGMIESSMLTLTRPACATNCLLSRQVRNDSTTHRLAENAAFTGKVFHMMRWTAEPNLCFRPVHLIYGDNNDMFSRFVDNEGEGRVFASVTRLEDVGHLVPQQAPTQLAVAILAVLTNSPELKPVLSKL
ncbi:hypothetical protein BJ912DRAFT_934422 [Pholiota molesta]|nr:hypothetical protein BJ912DRAFT_934422 [Pholiota molesta]